MRQADLFDPAPRPDLFDENRPPVLVRADPEKVRRELLALLAKARAAETMPWPREILRYHQTVFPQMSRWLPENEARQLCLEFAHELERLMSAQG
jgi:hypothetical protein